MGKLLGLIAAIFLAGTALAENLTPRAFTEVAAAAARRAMPSAGIAVVGDLQLETRTGSREAISTDLRNAYEVYLRDPLHLEDVLRRYIGVLAETVRLGNVKGAVDRASIVPVLKPVRWVVGVRTAQGTRESPQPLTEPFNDELAIVYAEDRPQLVRYLTTRDDVGDRAKLRALALDNLRRVIPKIEMEGNSSGSFIIHAGGSYEASLLLVDDLWSSGQIKVDGDIVVAVPSREALLVTGSHNQASIRLLRSAAVKLAAGPYALTSALFVYRGGKFVRFDQ